MSQLNDLLELFSWPEYTGSDIKFRKATAFRELGKTEESANFTKKWVEKEPENIVAATAGVYSFIDTEEYDDTVEVSVFSAVNNPYEIYVSYGIMYGLI